MRTILSSTALFTLLAAAPAHAGTTPADVLAQEPPRTFSILRAHLSYLSDDLHEGRAPGTRGGALAERYLAKELSALGFSPGGDGGGYLQRVELRGTRTLREESALAWVDEDGIEAPLVLGEAAVVGCESGKAEVEIDAPLVFVGYGITAPEQGFSDYEGVDVRGKVVLAFVNDPPSHDPAVFGGPALTYMGRWTYKYEEAARQGAAGALLIHRDGMAGYGFHVVQASFARERPSLARGDGEPKLDLVGWVTDRDASGLLAGVGLDLEEMLAAAGEPGFRGRELPYRVRARVRSELRDFAAHNVIGVLPGAALPHEHVVYSAHWDHLGLDPALEEDPIYNGAVDNSSGCAALLAVARRFAEGERPRRSIAVLFTTAEEGGLLGSERFAQSPPAAIGPIEHVVANLNLDGLCVDGTPLEFEILGADRSTLGPIAERQAAALGAEVTGDSRPDLGLFYRSDHLNFARAGVPALHFKTGRRFEDREPERVDAEREAYTALRYHRPSDAYDPAWDLKGTVLTAILAHRVGLEVANAEETPRYHEGDEFARR